MQTYIIRKPVQIANLDALARPSYFPSQSQGDILQVRQSPRAGVVPLFIPSIHKHLFHRSTVKKNITSESSNGRTYKSAFKRNTPLSTFLPINEEYRSLL